jgi:hypothetical protein
MWSEFILANDKSIRHVLDKVQKLFGSRKVGDDSYDAKLRPKNRDEMNQRIRAFVECKEQWHMLKQRAIMQSKASPDGFDSCPTHIPRREDPHPNDTQPDSLMTLAHTVKFDSGATVKISNFDFPSEIGFATDDNPDEVYLPIDDNPDEVDLQIDDNPDEVDLLIGDNSGGIHIPIDYNPGEWGVLNGGRFSTSDGDWASDPVRNSSAGSFTSANSFAHSPRVLQRRARNRKNQRASRTSHANSTIVTKGSNISCRRT